MSLLQRLGRIAGFVLLVAACTVVSITVSKKAQERNIRPSRYAQKASAFLRSKLHLNQEQTDALEALLLAHRVELNRLDHQEYETWDHLFSSLNTASPSELTRDVDAINRVQGARNAARLAELQKIRLLLTPDQKEKFADFNKQAAERLLQTLEKYEQ